MLPCSAVGIIVRSFEPPRIVACLLTETQLDRLWQGRPDTEGHEIVFCRLSLSSHVLQPLIGDLQCIGDLQFP